MYLIDIKAWLKASRLRLNTTKTQLMWLGSPQQLAKVNVLEVPVASTRWSQRWRVTLESSSTVSCRCLHRWPPCVWVATTSYGSYDRSSAETVKMLVQAFISAFRVTWTTAIHCFMASQMVWRADCSLSRMWLHVWCRMLDITTASCQCYRSCTGFWFEVECISTWPPWSTCHCSADQCICHVPCQNSTFGDRSFAAAGPRTWNELPFSLRDTGSLSLITFNEHLKTYLFLVAFWGHSTFVTFMISLCRVKIYLLTYLLPNTYLTYHTASTVFTQLLSTHESSIKHKYYRHKFNTDLY